MKSVREQIDLLSSLRLPDRYEPLYGLVGEELATILVPPSPEAKDVIEGIVDFVRAGTQGALLPLAGSSGAGKTTFASSINHWEGKEFTSTLTYSGRIEFDDLAAAVTRFRADLPTNDKRVIPINIDHRESAPPTDGELAALKRFLRTSPGGAPALIFWPETDTDIARSLGERYKSIAGAQPTAVLSVEGPPRSEWIQIAGQTLQLSNNITDLEYIGVSPADYDPQEFPSLGEFLRKIKNDFNANLATLRRSITKPVALVIAFASESDSPGVLASLTNSSRYGLLDATGLLAATPDSVIGKWWSTRRGLLTRVIVQLNVHALSLSPAATISAIRNCGPAADEFLDSIGIRRHGAGRAVRDLGRTDLGRLLLGKPLARFEARGTPAKDAGAAFQLLAERGFNLGKDKKLNQIMADAWRAFLATNISGDGVVQPDVRHEKSLEFCQLIPDNSILYADFAICIEYTWRKGDFLSQGNRSTVAQYILEKLKNYARELGWTPA
ncbi:MAG: hypothetical protein ACK4YQ_01235 [Phenylobacterium sp.]|uniref:hypothetical protein n=1 Tax=Phenylobacterium sp. TaxID=1871053 RepID=UPI00391B3A28